MRRPRAPADAASMTHAPPPTSRRAVIPGPWGRSRIPQSEPAEPPKPRPRLREAKPAGGRRAPRHPRRRPGAAILIGTTITKTAVRTATNVAVREASKAIFGSGRNSGVLGGIVRGVLGSLVK